MLSNKDFFDTAASYYNEMTDFASAVKKRTTALKNFTEGISSAADLGCGTGIDSIALSAAGIKVDAFDISSGMIEAAMKNASAFNAAVDFHNFGIADIPENFHNRYGLITSLGNTLSNIDAVTLGLSLRKIFAMLSPGGKFLMQILNYDFILDSKERIVNIAAGEIYHYIRFYDFHPGYIQFNILKYPAQNASDYELISTKLYPHTAESVLPLLTEAGFAEISFCGGLNKSPFEPTASKDLVILCAKPL